MTCPPVENCTCFLYKKLLYCFASCVCVCVCVHIDRERDLSTPSLNMRISTMDR